MAIEIATDDNFKQKLSGKRTIVKYYAGWCGSCRLFAPKFRRLSNDDRFSDVQFVDVDAEKNPAARNAAGVTNLPFFATFEGEALKEARATSKEEAVVELLSNLQS